MCHYEEVERQQLLRPDAPPAPVLGDSRSQVLAALRAAGGASSVADIARRVGLHPNTARFHLDGLVGQGLAQRESEQRDAPGRPRSLYRPTAESAPSGRRSYRLLAEILTSYLATQTPRPADAARQAGEAWGRFLTERPAPFRTVDAHAATEQLLALLDEIGFAPEVVGPADRREIRLHQCPFLEVAQEHREVVCAVHLGLMRGMLDELDAPLEATRLDPFVEPDLCITRLANTAGDADRAGVQSG